MQQSDKILTVDYFEETSGIGIRIHQMCKNVECDLVIENAVYLLVD